MLDLNTRVDFNEVKVVLLVDEEFGAAILRDAAKEGFITAMSVEKSGLSANALDARLRALSPPISVTARVVASISSSMR